MVGAKIDHGVGELETLIGWPTDGELSGADKLIGDPKFHRSGASRLPEAFQLDRRSC